MVLTLIPMRDALRAARLLSDLADGGYELLTAKREAATAWTAAMAGDDPSDAPVCTNGINVVRTTLSARMTVDARSLATMASLAEGFEADAAVVSAACLNRLGMSAELTALVMETAGGGSAGARTALAAALCPDAWTALEALAASRPGSSLAEMVDVARGFAQTAADHPAVFTAPAVDDGIAALVGPLARLARAAGSLLPEMAALACGGPDPALWLAAFLSALPHAARSEYCERSGLPMAAASRLLAAYVASKLTASGGLPGSRPAAVLEADRLVLAWRGAMLRNDPDEPGRLAALAECDAVDGPAVAGSALARWQAEAGARLAPLQAEVARRTLEACRPAVAAWLVRTVGRSGDQAVGLRTILVPSGITPLRTRLTLVAAYGGADIPVPYALVEQALARATRAVFGWERAGIRYAEPAAGRGAYAAPGLDRADGFVELLADLYADHGGAADSALAPWDVSARSSRSPSGDARLDAVLRIATIASGTSAARAWYTIATEADE